MIRRILQVLADADEKRATHYREIDPEGMYETLIPLGAFCINWSDAKELAWSIVKETKKFRKTLLIPPKHGELVSLIKPYVHYGEEDIALETAKKLATAIILFLYFGKNEEKLQWALKLESLRDTEGDIPNHYCPKCQQKSPQPARLP